MTRCAWAAKITDQEYLDYHDTEWNVPRFDDIALFEYLCLEGAQAGLSWLTILKKRGGYRKEFLGFDFTKICAKMTPKNVEGIMTRGLVVKHAGKINSVLTNAKSVLILLTEFSSLHAYFLTHLEGVDTTDRAITQRAVSTVSTQISTDLKKRGFKFVGPTTIQAFLQATGLFAAHDYECFSCLKN